MDANPPQHYPVNYYYVPERKVSPNAKLLQPNFEIKPSMDLCNLYVRGLKPGVTSTELFNVFKPFGRIISARAMEDNNSNCKAGFGFVSFSSSVEAAQAMIDINSEHPSKSQKKEKKDKSSPIMTVRFHEPRVPRPEHNFGQQLELLSNSHLSAHFYTRERHKLVPLGPNEDQQQQVIVSVPLESENRSQPANISPIPAPFFPVNSHGQPYYYIPSYWTDNQGNVYTNYICPQPLQQQPVPSQYHQHHTQQEISNAKNEKRQSLKDNTTKEVTDKLLELLKSEYKITSDENSKLLVKLMKMNHIEQSNCLNNSVYLKKKIDLLKEEQ